MFSTLGIVSFTLAFTSVLAVNVGGFEDGGLTLVSAMMVSHGVVSVLDNTLAYSLDVPWQ